MMEIVRLAVGNGLHTRSLAWAAGEISDLDFYTSIKDYANEMGIDYIMPNIEG
jgi:hypothetical protein